MLYSGSEFLFQGLFRLYFTIRISNRLCLLVMKLQVEKFCNCTGRIGVVSFATNDNISFLYVLIYSTASKIFKYI
jgi:hypothetical protein